MSPNLITTNTLFHGENLPFLREYIAGESIDLIYLDPIPDNAKTSEVLKPPRSLNKDDDSC